MAFLGTSLDRVVFKRLIWFGSGAVSGAAGSWYIKRRIQEKLRRFTPGGMRETAVVKARQAQRDAKTAVAEARRLAADYRSQIRADDTTTG